MRLVDYLLNNYNTDADVHWLVDYHDIWLMPEVNPDGHHIVEAEATAKPVPRPKERQQRRRRRVRLASPASDQFGVDNNRNFPFHWGCCKGSSGFVCDETYRGTSAGSEPEDMAIVNKIRALVPTSAAPTTPTRRLLLPQAFTRTSTQMRQVNLFTWGWTTTRMPNFAETNNIAAHMAAGNAGGTVTPMARSSNSCIR